jgi:hypothetical protein
MKNKYISGKTFLLEEMFPKLNIFCMVYRLSRNFIDLNSLTTYLNHYFGIVSLLQKLPRSNIYIYYLKVTPKTFYLFGKKFHIIDSDSRALQNKAEKVW